MAGRNKPLTDRFEEIRKDHEIAEASNKESLRPWERDFWLSMMDKAPVSIPSPTENRLVTPKELWSIACLYFAGANEDTMVKKDFIRSGESAGMIVEITTERPYSWASFELFAAYKGVRYSLKAIKDNRDNRYPEYQEVVARIEQIIYQQKFDGAAIGGYNPQLIIRDLGLAEKVDASVKQEQPLFGDAPQPPKED